MLFYGATRGVKMIIEQPLNSLLYWTPEMKDTLKIAQAARHVTFLGAFGSPTAKPVELYSTLSPIVKIVRSRRLAHKRLGKSRPSSHFRSEFAPRKGKPRSTIAKRASGWPSRQWVNGKSDVLKSSQTYPVEFCSLLAGLIVDDQ